VALGVYRASPLQTISFNVHPGVAVYGGFAGTEISREQRDPALHRTVLSGDIDFNDAGSDGVDSDVSQIIGFNTYVVVMMDGTTALGPITETTVLDGFTITGGNAVSGAEHDGGGLFCNGAGSGKECSPTLRNLRFSGNHATVGGAIFNSGNGGTSSPTLSNVTFSGNSAQSGGAMANYGLGATGRSNPTLSNVSFSGNSATQGGAITNNSISGTSKPTLVNVTFSGNSATTGSAIYNYAFSGGISAPSLHNVILWGDTGGGAEIANDAASGTTLDHSIVQGGCPGGSSCTNLITDDPLLGTLTDNGGATQTLLPGIGGSAIDAGDDDACSAAPVNGLDQRGVARPQGAHCDMGSVESTDTIFRDGFE
jgi:hypothetical protein